MSLDVLRTADSIALPGMNMVRVGMAITRKHHSPHPKELAYPKHQSPKTVALQECASAVVVLKHCLPDTTLALKSVIKGYILSFQKNWNKAQWACGHVDVGTCPHQLLAATLTLSQPGGQIMPTLYTGVHTKF